MTPIVPSADEAIATPCEKPANIATTQSTTLEVPAMNSHRGKSAN